MHQPDQDNDIYLLHSNTNSNGTIINKSNVDNMTKGIMISNYTMTDDYNLWKTILLGVLLIVAALLTITGNVLVFIAFLRERYMRKNLTNWFLVSLAIADLLVGIIVMPFAIYHTLYDAYWPFGRDWCDIWHAFDVLSSTASILNLCAIALERFWATENPITHTSMRTRRHCLLMLTIVWICSVLISFPAILWWRNTQDYDNSSPEVCHFTSDSIYLFVSSCVSFYIPLVVMLVVYARIYRTANNLMKYQTDFKRSYSFSILSCLSHPQDSQRFKKSQCQKSQILPFQSSTYTKNPQRLQFKQWNSSTWRYEQNHFTDYQCNNNKDKKYLKNHSSVSNEKCNTSQIEINSLSKTKCWINQLREFARKKCVCKFAREQKAAKTLGIIMGLFILCWLPFFICNILIAFNPHSLNQNDGFKQAHILVTWLGYINSCINPIIYAHSMHEFRRAFKRLLCFHWWYRKQIQLRKSTTFTSRCLSHRITSQHHHPNHNHHHRHHHHHYRHHQNCQHQSDDHLCKYKFETVYEMHQPTPKYPNITDYQSTNCRLLHQDHENSYLSYSILVPNLSDSICS
ncbi:putative amine GPCR [Schistosoma mansoni]|uniref:putative amine GPCR n=1 Tax=Schistosoma mansoni TaxID=6183 RepID=UPI00022DC774|nr:putative amine GPCR [Schistosoma mansoni]|eukprot:XP_018651133.1 putative amine GPCR [Schistosoma mansoni]